MALLALLSSLALATLSTAAVNPHPGLLTREATPYDPGFDIAAVAQIAEDLPSHSWEYGTASETLLELRNPALSVFGSAPFPVPTVIPALVPAMDYASTRIVIGTGANGLSDGAGAVGDPASLGVVAILLGKTNDTFAVAAASEIDYMLNQAPRWANGAISQRADVPELWADFMYMAPPFIAYYGADQNNASLIETAYLQCGYYRQVLLFNSSSTTFSPVGTAPNNGLWRHIIGPQSQELGLWSTGNAWAAAGMLRVLQTVIKAPAALDASWRDTAISDLTAWIKEIIDGARASPMDGGLLRNYLDDVSGDGHGFGEISGSSMLAAVTYRMVATAPTAFPASEYLPFAEGIRGVLGGVDADGNPHITADGIATPAVNPLGWSDTAPWTAGSPEGNNFVVLLYSAWRDCIDSGVCSQN
ncbi:hypothetical protein FB45DRAFT_999750 [Roridomyces roridus]|uniref:Six-hairpin glycosidase n=1 Tax=Roridomyces roridus TaxID=1738132 RepID=A0AAD7CCI3_9AGAR|nr:hypothetical protein FB45DRAFT_999750 [Roridomyces roridus]